MSRTAPWPLGARLHPTRRRRRARRWTACMGARRGGEARRRRRASPARSQLALHSSHRGCNVCFLGAMPEILIVDAPTSPPAPSSRTSSPTSPRFRRAHHLPYESRAPLELLPGWPSVNTAAEALPLPAALAPPRRRRRHRDRVRRRRRTRGESDRAAPAPPRRVERAGGAGGDGSVRGEVTRRGVLPLGLSPAGGSPPR